MMQGPSPCQKLKFKLSSLLLLFFRFNQDHSQPNLIWNYKVSSHTMQMSFFFFLFFYRAILLFEISLQTREELREALEAEMRAFAVDKVGHKLRPLFVQFLIWSVNQVKKSFKTHTICKRQRLLRSLSIFCKWCVF